MRNIIRASIILSFATLISLAVTVIKRKILAVYLGPAGLGVYAQLFNYFNIATIIATFGISQAITTYIARNGTNAVATKNAANEIFKSAFSLLLFFSFIIVLSSVLFSRHISALVVNDASVYYLLIIVIFGIPFQVSGQAFLSFLQGFKQTKKISMANIGTSIIGLLGMIPLVIFWGTFGAALSVLFLAIVTFLFFICVSQDSLEIRSLWKAFNFIQTFKSFYARKLVNFGLLRFVQTTLYWLTFLIMRSIIIRKLGVTSNGIYEAVYTFSMLYLPFISNILWSYSYSEYCQAQDNLALLKAVNKFLRISTLMVFPIIIFFILARSILIERLIFTNQFSMAVKLLPVRLLVDLVTVITWSVNVVLLAKDRLKVAVWFEVIKDIVFLSSLTFIASAYQLKGILMMDISSSSLLLLLSYVYIRRNFAFRFIDDNLYLVISALAIIVVVSLFPVNNFIFVLAGIALSLVWLMRFVSLKEVRAAVSSLRALIPSIS